MSQRMNEIIECLQSNISTEQRFAAAEQLLAKFRFITLREFIAILKYSVRADFVDLPDFNAKEISLAKQFYSDVTRKIDDNLLSVTINVDGDIRFKETPLLIESAKHEKCRRHAKHLEESLAQKDVTKRQARTKI